MDPIQALADKVSSIVINPLLALLFAVGLLVFVYGVVEFIWGLNVGGGHDADRGAGKRHMLWGLVGMFVMASAYAILQIIRNSIGTGSL